MCGEGHSDAADSYTFIGVIQQEMKDDKSALRSHERALQIRLKLFGENHPDTAESYDYIQLVQDRMKTGLSIRLEQMKSSNFVKRLLRRIFYKSITKHSIMKDSI